MPDPAARPRTFCRRIVSLCLASLAGALLVAAAGAASELRQTPIVKAVQRARPSVVNIRGEKTVVASGVSLDASEIGRRVNGMGTGIVIDSRGYIITNHHVVDGVRQIQVTLACGRQCIATLLAHDPETDLAIIKLDLPDPLPVIPLGTSSDLMPGETVVAVGNAFGYEHTVTRGIISALHRAVQVSDAQYYDDLIQTDASINPGNSGGPLLNIDGEMIGINVAVRAGAQGIGFAIPVDKTMAVAGDLLARYGSDRTWHGVVLAADPGVAPRGVLVASVAPKSPAASAGLESGDLIAAVDDEKVERTLDFHRAMLERQAGEKIRLAVQRAGGPIAVQLELAAVPQPPQSHSHPVWDLLGMELEAMPAKEFSRRFPGRYRGGLTVTSVIRGGPAAQQGIRPGDVLVGMHIWETVSIENVSYILKRPDFANLNPVKFYILRGDETLYGYLPLAAKTARRG